MAKFISISGPCTSGKTSLVESLSTYKEMNNIVFSPDMHDVVWNELVEGGYFQEYTEVTTDSDYLCIYIMRLLDYYNKYIESYKDTDKIVLLDGCWVDLSIYSLLNMWYTRGIKDIQEEILAKAAIFDESISRIYITRADDLRYPVDKFRLRGKMSTFRANRPLEIRYYELASHMKNAMKLPSSEISECSLFIVEDLKKLGYI